MAKKRGLAGVRPRADPGTEVNLTILRPSSGQLKDYRLTRSVINVDMVKDINSKKLFPLGENKIGYIRLCNSGKRPAMTWRRRSGS